MIYIRYSISFLAIQSWWIDLCYNIKITLNLHLDRIQQCSFDSHQMLFYIISENWRRGKAMTQTIRNSTCRTTFVNNRNEIHASILIAWLPELRNNPARTFPCDRSRRMVEHEPELVIKMARNYFGHSNIRSRDSEWKSLKRYRFSFHSRRKMHFSVNLHNLLVTIFLFKQIDFR